MTAASFELEVAPPPGSAPGTLPPPDLTQAPQLALEQWASAGHAGATVLAWGCVSGDVGQWSDDATELAQTKLIELASSTLSRMGSASPGLHVTAAHRGPLTLEQSLESDGSARARTLLAFTSDPPRAHACIVVCADAGRCGESLADARPAASGELRPPPPAGLALHALAGTVHHPHAALGVLLGAVLFAAALAVVTRPRPPRRKG